jgi:hypothetical protein
LRFLIGCGAGIFNFFDSIEKRDWLDEGLQDFAMTIERHAQRLLFNPDRGTMQVIRCTAAVAAIEADVTLTCYRAEPAGRWL